MRIFRKSLAQTWRPGFRDPKFSSRDFNITSGVFFNWRWRFLSKGEEAPKNLSCDNCKPTSTEETIADDELPLPMAGTKSWW
jgi:hypothetical protein